MGAFSASELSLAVPTSALTVWKWAVALAVASSASSNAASAFCNCSRICVTWDRAMSRARMVALWLAVASASLAGRLAVGLLARAASLRAATSACHFSMSSGGAFACFMACRASSAVCTGSSLSGCVRPSAPTAPLGLGGGGDPAGMSSQSRAQARLHFLQSMRDKKLYVPQVAQAHSPFLCDQSAGLVWRSCCGGMGGPGGLASGERLKRTAFAPANPSRGSGLRSFSSNCFLVSPANPSFNCHAIV